jgi:hypothetical protein
VRAAVVDAGRIGEPTLPSISKRDGPLDHPVAFTSVIRILINDVSFAPILPNQIERATKPGLPEGEVSVNVWCMVAYNSVERLWTKQKAAERDD